MLLLPDVSEWQSSLSPDWVPALNFPALKAVNGGAAIIRAGYGATYQDHCFTKMRAAAHQAGFVFLGLYQYLVATADPAVQAEAFCTWVGNLQPGEIPILDLEEGSGDQSQRAQTWLDYVDTHLGLGGLPLNQRSWVYSSVSFAEQHGLSGVFASARHTWVASYSTTEPSIGHTLWQCSDGVSGAYITAWPGAGRCDVNLYHGTVAELASFAYHPDSPSPTEDPMTPACCYLDGLHVFYISTDKECHYLPSAGGVQNLGGQFTGGLAAAASADGVISVVGRGTDTNVWRNELTGGKWSGWVKIGGPAA